MTPRLIVALAATLLLATVTSPLVAQTPSPPPEATPPPVPRASLQGKVVDVATGQPVPEARVTLITAPRAETVTDQNGEFHFDGRIPGVHEVEVSRLGYVTLRVQATVSETSPVLVLEVESMALPGPQLEVTTTRATERETPTAFTELSRPEIKERYWSQDVPMLLAETPGTYAYSDAGNGIGYSYVKLRGFAQRRVAVTINGIPLNDPETHEVYWVDHPDLLASASTIQVQRGVGSALYGASAVGGAINVETLKTPMDRRIAIEAGGGSYGTQRFSAQFQSGLLDNAYILTGRYSRIRSEGYRERSWSDLWSYAFSVARLDSWITSRLNLYGGPERLHLAYFAVDRAYLDGRITGDADQDRRFNPLEWPNATDNFFEPHYELLQDVKLTERASLSSSLFYFPGKGHYDDLPFGPQLFSDRHMPDFTVGSSTQYPSSYYAADTTGGAGPFTVIASDLTQRLWVRNYHYGWAPRARLRHDKGELTVGGEWREHTGRHWGEITWSAALAPGVPPNFVFYDYTGRVNVISGFVQEAYDLRPDLRLTGSLQLRRTRYAIGDDRYNGYDFDLHYTSLNPRVGVNWNANDRWNVFGSYAHAEVEPILGEIYRPDDPTSVPLFRVVDPVNDIYEDPLIDPEKLNDYEAGIGYRTGSFTAKVNGFWMDFRDEIVPLGQVDQFGVPITGNAARSTHRGVELEWSGRRGSFELSGNLTLSENFFDEYQEFVNDTTVNDYSGNSIAGFPNRLANVTLGYRRGGVYGGLTVVEIGRQYLDNTEDNRKNPSLREVPGYQHRYVEQHAVLNGRVSLDLTGLTGFRPFSSSTLALDIHALNLTDLKYETAGYVFFDVPYFIPAAGRNVFASLRAEF
jgi:iron complex outermembrane recepter protein